MKKIQIECLKRYGPDWTIKRRIVDPASGIKHYEVYLVCDGQGNESIMAYDPKVKR